DVCSSDLDDDSQTVGHLESGGQLLPGFSSGVQIQTNIVLRQEFFNLHTKLPIPTQAIPAFRSGADEDCQRLFGLLTVPASLRIVFQPAWLLTDGRRKQSNKGDQQT